MQVPELQEIWQSQDPLRRLGQIRHRKISSGKGIIDLSMLNPDLPAPRLLLDRMMEASAKTANQRYSVSRGIRKLREGFCFKYAARFGVELNADKQVCACLGTKDAILNSLRVMASRGEAVLLPRPTYPAHLAASRLAYLRPEFYDCDSSLEAVLQNIEAAQRETGAKVIVLNFPSNPAGLDAPKEFLQDLLTLAESRNCHLLNDFVYGELVHSKGAATSLLSCRGALERCVETYSLSKAYSVPGWRIGAVLGNSEIVSKVARLKSVADYGAYLPLQLAASFGLSSGEDLVAPVREEYKLRARLVSEGLRRLGFRCETPQAGGSVWACLPDSLKAHYLSAGSQEAALMFCEELLEQRELLLSPGVLFGSGFGDWIRVALSAKQEQLRDSLDRIQSLLEAKGDRLAPPEKAHAAAV
ncbi:MAG: hypothetical protein DCC75_04940 [Proteobacteria bacterium]|nr:MAG: hypothetical protein DCC75_04940 [Pseudomonadota bacterium]